MKNNFTRRNFIKLSALSSAFLGLSGFTAPVSRETVLEKINDLSKSPIAKGKSVIGLTVPPIKQVKVAFIGLGNRGIEHLKLVNALAPDKAIITAICDVQKVKTDAALEELKKSGHGQKPAVYSGTLDIWKEMIKRDDIDLVIISTHWEYHTPMGIEAMRNKIHVAVEVPAAYILDDLWALVDTAEEMQVNCMMMENVCYGDEELWLLNMAQQKVAGLVRQVRAGLPEAIDELESFEQATLTYEINIQQEFPVQTEIPFNETFEVPIQLTVPISQTIHTSVMIDPLGTGLQIPVEVNVPVNLEAPIDTSVPIAIERSIPISTTIPLDLNVPLAIKVAETDLAQYVAQLRTGLASLDEILAGLEP